MPGSLIFQYDFQQGGKEIPGPSQCVWPEKEALPGIIPLILLPFQILPLNLERADSPSSNSQTLSKPLQRAVRYQHVRLEMLPET